MLSASGGVVNLVLFPASVTVIGVYRVSGGRSRAGEGRRDRAPPPGPAAEGVREVHLTQHRHPRRPRQAAGRCAQRQLAINTA